MYRTKMVLAFLLSWGILWVASAQGNPDEPTISPISIGTPVEDIITEAAIFDWWVITISAGETIQVTMTGTEGLAPLLGLLDESSELVQRSPDGEANGTVRMTYTAEEAGEFRIVATRTGNADGTTVGRYVLRVDNIEPDTPAQTQADPYREVTFLCNDQEVPNVLRVEVEDDKTQTSFISVSVYGLDGLIPALRTTLEFDFDPFYDQFCIEPDGEGPGFGRGDRLKLPDEEEIVWENGVTKTNFRDADAFGIIQLNIGALNDTTGRYVMVIDGLTVGRDGDRDLIELGLGPLTRDTSVRVYAISDKSSRLDSNVQLIDESTIVLLSCDDAGERNCANLPSIEGFEWYSAEHDTSATGGRFDGGLLLQPDSPDKQRLLVGGFDGRTYGDYTIVIIGEYPPVE